MSITLAGVFDTHSQAAQACKKLEAAGVEKRFIQLSGGEAESGTSAVMRKSAEPREDEGAISRFFSNLFGANDDADAANYSEAVRRGNAVVTVNVADESRSDEISEILEDCGALDVDERVAQWKASGYTPPVGARQDSRQSGATDDTLEVVQEELKVGKRTVEQGGVRVRRYTTATPVEEQVSLHEERAVVDRKKVDRPASEADLQAAFKDQNFEIRETAEEAVVSKAARVVEEVKVGKVSSDRVETVRDNVRRTQVDVETLSGAPPRKGQEQERRLNTGGRYYAGVDRRKAA